jgi:hypothetical protein
VPHVPHRRPVPAELSSAIPAALTQLAHATPLQDAEAPHLPASLATSVTREVTVGAATRRSWRAAWCR